MHTTTLITAALFLAAAFCATLSGQPPAPSQPGPEHLEQLATCREGIVDPDAREEDRRRWTELLFFYDTAAARELGVELLQLSDRPDVQRTLCEVLRHHARAAPERIHESYVAPLMALLAAEDSGLRSAAARTLAEFRSSEVPVRLGLIAASPSEPLRKRLAAIEALAPNTHRREVVAELIKLLDCKEPQIIERVTAALGPANPESPGTDIQRWRTWWTQQSRLTEEQWLAGQLQLYRERTRRLNEQFDAFRERSAAEQSAIVNQLRSFQRDLFRALGAEQRPGKLIEWLDSPLPVVQGTALSIIKARIADEGKRPEGEVLAALLRLLANSTPATRREVLLIVQNVNDPAVVDAVLDRLAAETDLQTRLALLSAAGKLNAQRAIPALLRELKDPAAKLECVREAALALGEIASRRDLGDALQDAVPTLKQRYRTAPAGAVGLQAALLTAMAGIAVPAFAPEMLEVVELDEATLLRPAIRGLRILGERSKLPRFRTLMQHADPQVRLAAVEAVAQLGREDADLEGLLTRLNPTAEQNELVREAAWRGFKEFLGRRPIEARIQAADRLRDRPDLEAAYLKELADALALSDGKPAELTAIHERLSQLLIGQQKHAEALPYVRKLFEAERKPDDPPKFDRGLRWLETALRTPALQDLAESVDQLARLVSSEDHRDRILRVVRAYFAEPDVRTDPDRASTVLEALRAVRPRGFANVWQAALSDIARAVESGVDGPDPPPDG